ncbi:hypothetical protein EBU71_00320 [bacterium]|nr:hypothetical protein [Candidatus Elulimicrobium humile]
MNMFELVNEYKDKGLSNNDIADELGISTKQVKNILSKNAYEIDSIENDYNHGAYYDDDASEVKDEILSEAGYYNNNY